MGLLFNGGYMANSLQVNSNEVVAGLGTFAVTLPGVAGTAEVTDITAVADVAGSLNSTFFNLFSAKNATGYYVWFDNGGGVDPAVPGKTGVHVVYSNNATANTIAGLVRTALTGNPNFTITGATSHIIVTNTATGATTNASNGTASPGFSYSVTTSGTTASPEFVYLSVDVQSTLPNSSALAVAIKKNASTIQSYGGAANNPTPTQPSIGGKAYINAEGGDSVSVVLTSANVPDYLPNGVKSNINIQIIESQ